MSSSRRRTARLRAWASGLLPRPVSPEPELDPVLHAVSLAALLDEAVALQPAADDLVLACGLPGEVPGQVAQRATELTGRYHRLLAELERMPLPAEYLPLREHAERLLTYHLWMLHESLHLAFPNCPDSRVESARLRLDGLGAPAAILRDLRERAHAQIVEPVPRRGARD
ncbi:hypothetical protein [Streptacidiphilus monticola]|uniref:Hemerythrin-like domain-containing protein n=1 Tax=Streptacidiphilus monticola TaxID=2161674 RepID=A0ABW1G132_9ACTN